MLLISPSSVTVETNQLLQVRARGRNRAGDDVVAPVTWSTTGGTILPDGRFSAASVGSYQIAGRARTREGTTLVQTSTIKVVRGQANLKSVVMTPTSATLNPGVSQTFAAVGRLANGDTVPIGVTWSARGGTIDAGGLYVAGDAVGTFQVIAIKNAGTLADTAIVTIAAPPSPPPPSDSTPPAPAPVLAQVTLVPASATLAPRTTKQFSAYARTTTGDSVAVNVVFTATGGTVTSGGLFTAGTTAGSFKLIAAANGLADTSVVTVTAPLGSGTPTGVPFGSYECIVPNQGPFNLCIRAAGSWTAAEMAALQTVNGKMILAQGGYDKFRQCYPTCTSTVTSPTRQFDPVKYYNWVQTLKPYVASWQPYLLNGTLGGVQVIDDRHANNWGGVTITNAQIDAMAKAWKGIIPGITTFSSGGYAWDMVGYTYGYLDGTISQYNGNYMGDVTIWRDKSLAASVTSKLSIILSMNVINGGKVVTGCFHGGKDTMCSMSPTELRSNGAAFAAASGACGLASWKTDQIYQAQPGVTDALKYVAGLAAAHPAASCRVR